MTKSCRFRIAVLFSGLGLGLGLGCGHSDDASRRSEGPRVEEPAPAPRSGAGSGPVAIYSPPVPTGSGGAPAAPEMPPAGAPVPPPAPAAGGKGGGGVPPVGAPGGARSGRRRGAPDRPGAGRRQPGLERPRSPRRPLLRRVAADRPSETIYLVKGGKVVWTHAIGDSDELGDCTLTSYGTVFFSRKAYGGSGDQGRPGHGQGRRDRLGVQAGRGSEVHAVQPIGDRQVHGHAEPAPPKLMIIDKKAAKGCTLRQTPASSGCGTHPRRRQRARHVPPRAHPGQRQSAGALHRQRASAPGGRVQAGVPRKELQVWEYDHAPGSAWAAVRLRQRQHPDQRQQRRLGPRGEPREPGQGRLGA